jgi:hypothetical protein
MDAAIVPGGLPKVDAAIRFAAAPRGELPRASGQSQSAESLVPVAAVAAWLRREE